MPDQGIPAPVITVAEDAGQSDRAVRRPGRKEANTMVYRCWTHVALAVGRLREAEEFYARLFGMTVAFREARADDGWRTLPAGAGWDSARAAGIEPQLSSLRRDGVVIALEAIEDEREGNRLSHIGMAIDAADLSDLRPRARNFGCAIVTDRDDLLVFDDPYGVRWEVSITAELTSTGARTGRWIDIPA
jgi:catechol 2,3-dioxygenase-like lactoylglutathione lyase family enzyme